MLQKYSGSVELLRINGLWLRVGARGRVAFKFGCGATRLEVLRVKTWFALIVFVAPGSLPSTRTTLSGALKDEAGMQNLLYTASACFIVQISACLMKGP